MQTAVKLRELIACGKLVQGAQLASERDLADLLRVSRNAVRQALEILEEEHLIGSTGGRGRVVLSSLAGSPNLPTRMRSIALVTDGGAFQQDLTPQPSGWHQAIPAGIVSEMFSRGIATLLVPLNSEGPAQPLWEHVVPSGMVVLSARKEWQGIADVFGALEMPELPTVIYGDVIDWSGCDRVCSDHREGGRRLVQWLAGKGAKRILRVAEFEEQAARAHWQTEREGGCLEACHAHGLPVLPEVNIPGFPGYNFSRQHFEASSHQIAGYLFRILQEADPVDAILAASDGLVGKIAEALRILGRDPDSCLICGYDNYWQDLPDRDWMPFIPDATIDKQNLTIGRSLVSLLLQRLDGELADQPVTRMIPPELVVPLKARKN